MPYKDPVIRALKAKGYRKTHYEANKEQIIAKVGIHKRKARAQFAAFKATLSCINCGEDHPATLDFHHHTPKPTNRKVNELTSLGAYNAAIEEIMRECVVLCSNCHRKHHFEERKKNKGAEAP